MLGLHGGSSRKLSNLLNHSMGDLEAYLDFFVDDVQLGIGNALDQEALEREQREEIAQLLKTVERLVLSLFITLF